MEKSYRIVDEYIDLLPPVGRTMTIWLVRQAREHSRISAVTLWENLNVAETWNVGALMGVHWLICTGTIPCVLV